MNPFELPPEGSGQPIKTRCPCGAERSERDILCPLLIDVRPVPEGDGLQRCSAQARCCIECGTLYVTLEAHSTQ